MPNRYLREAYITSPRINDVSPESRDLWVRLLLSVDDFGRFHGDPQIVASKCFPLCPHAGKCSRMLSELQRAGLLLSYRVEGKQYLALTQWTERPRSKSKFPAPDEGKTEPCEQPASNCEQMLATANICAPPSPSISPSISPSPSPTAPSRIGLGAGGTWEGISETDLALWRDAYPAVNVSAELARAAAWSIANPANRKSNWHRFIANWLSRAQDKAARVAAAAPKPAERRVAL